MDIQGLSSLASVASTNQSMGDISTAVLSKSLDTYETMGDQMTKMMEQSVTPNIGQNFDIRL